MLKKRATVLATLTLLVAVGVLIAQPGPGGRRGGPQMGPAGGPMGQWFDDLDKAYAQKDLDKIGELIDQMKQRRRQFQERAGDRAAGGPRPEMRTPAGASRQGMRGPIGGSRPGMGGPAGGQSINTRPPVAKGETETKILAVLDEMDRTQRRGNMNVPMEDGRFLRLLAETLGAKHVVEIGTSNGYSGIWQAMALKSTGGKLTTFEIDAGRAAMARQNFKKAGVESVITLIEGDAHEKAAQLDAPIDILFLDADKEGYIDYLDKLLPKVRPGGLIIAHNINPRQADPRYVEAITTNPGLETLILNHTGGISVTLKKRGLK